METMGSVSWFWAHYSKDANEASDPYPYLSKGSVCLLGDAGHPVRCYWIRSYGV